MFVTQNDIVLGTIYIEYEIILFELKCHCPFYGNSFMVCQRAAIGDLEEQRESVKNTFDVIQCTIVHFMNCIK